VEQSLARQGHILSCLQGLNQHNSVYVFMTDRDGMCIKLSDKTRGLRISSLLLQPLHRAYAIVCSA
jgi:hypothetical protein